MNIELQEDGGLLASVPALPGVIGYGEAEEFARRKVKTIALQVLAEIVESAHALASF